MKAIITFILSYLSVPFLVIFSILSRFINTRSIDIGLGPIPLINNVYHKKTLEIYGYKAETFVNDLYYITKDFDYIPLIKIKIWDYLLVDFWLFIRSIFRYKAIYIYFNGGILCRRKELYWLEPYLYKLANIKTVIMPYGGDIQDMLRTNNFIFKNVLSKDYPIHRLRKKTIAYQIDNWTKHADHIISGCDWVEYLYHWDTLMLAHFSIDTNKWKPNNSNINNTGTFKILHAPNHKNIKGSKHFEKAVMELKNEGLDIELILLQKVSNEKIKETMINVDMVADQLIIGWYAMFALEAMSLEKPVLCYLRQDFEELYIESGIIEKGEIPIINCTFLNVKEKIRYYYQNRKELRNRGIKGRKFVIKHHSLKAIGNKFNQINIKIGIKK